MRLCVNQDGVRLDYQMLGDEVHKTNILTIIASESYETFAKGLQNEIASTLKDRPQKVDIEFFTSKLVINEKGEKYRITSQDALSIYKLLYKSDIITAEDFLTPFGKEVVEKETFPLPENLENYRTSVSKLDRKSVV